MMNHEARRSSEGIARYRAAGRRLAIFNPRWILLILSLFPQISCSSYQARRELERSQFFVEILKREDPRWIGEDAFFERNLLANPDLKVRQWSAVALARIASPEALPLLYKALRSGDAGVRAASAFAIGAIEDRESLEAQSLDPDPKAIPELRRLLDDTSLTVRTRAVEALGRIGSHAEADEIVRGLTSFDSGMPAGRAYVESSITALARLKDPLATPALERLAATGDPEIQWRALDALIRLQSRASGPVFVRNLGNPDPNVRSYAAHGVGMVGDPHLAARLLPLLPPRSAQTGVPIPLAVRVSSLQALGELKNPSVIASIQAALSGDPIDDAHPGQQNFALQAAATLGLIGAREGEAVLLPLLTCRGPVADSAVIALAKILNKDPGRFFSIADRSQFTSPEALSSWVQAMAELGGPDAARELDRLLAISAGKPSPAEVETLPVILTALVKTDAPGWQDILTPFFSSHDSALLRGAVAAYKPGIHAKEPWAPIVQAFTASSACGDAGARIEILSYLKPWIHEAPVQQLLRSSLGDPERDVRLACAALLRRAGAADVAMDPGPSGGSITDGFCRALAATRKNSTIARLETSRGPIEIELFREDAPVTVANFVLMANRGAYNGAEFVQAEPLHRIEGRIPGNSAAGGRAIQSEINLRPFERGSVGMGLAGGRSETRRFFIALAPQPYLDGTHTCFGRVVSGMQVADRIVRGDRIRKVTVKETITLLDYHR